MSGASLAFLEFGILVALLMNLSARLVWRQAILLAASAVFLWQCAAGDSLIPLAGFVALGFAGLKLLESGRLRSATPLVILTLAIFIWLKQYTFLPSPLFLRSVYTTLGLSYILFRVIHLLLEAGGGALEGRVGLLSYLGYTLNFTSLIAGPIQRYPEFDQQQRAGARPSLVEAGLAAERTVLGMFKANVLGLVFSTIRADALQQALGAASWQTRTLEAGVAVAAYPFFLYCNFSGYIDIVIALASLMGIVLPENFDRPFAADSFIGFWSRWHITLSTWLRTYVYQPLLLTLMRRSANDALMPFWAVVSFFVTFFLVGAWHGQTSAFLFFGVLQGLGVSLNKLYEIVLTARLGRKRVKALAANSLYVAVCRGLTFTWFAFSLCWFWSDWPQLGKLATSIGAGGAAAALALMLAASTLGLAMWEAVRAALLGIEWRQVVVLRSRYLRTAWCTVLCLIVVAAEVVLRQPAPEIVYKKF